MQVVNYVDNLIVFCQETKVQKKRTLLDWRSLIIKAFVYVNLLF